MYDLFDQQAIESPPTRIMCAPRRASFSSSPRERPYHHRSSSSMSSSSTPSLRRLNASAPPPGERSRPLEENESPSSKMPRPFVPEMKRMMPLLLNSFPMLPKPESDGHIRHAPSFPPDSNESTFKPSISESRSREPILVPRQAQDISTHYSKHPFDATDHVIMRMEFVRPPVDVEELWIECFERWSMIHRKATADQWRWLYENRVLPTETAETFPRKPIRSKALEEGTLAHIPGKPLKTSRSLGLIEGSRVYNRRPKLSPKASSLASRRLCKKGSDKCLLDSHRTPTPLDLDFSKPSVHTRDQGYYAKDGNLTPVYYGPGDMSVSHPTGSYINNPSETTRNDEETSTDDDDLESIRVRESIDTTATSISSHQTNPSRSRSGSLDHHFVWTESDSTFQVPLDNSQQPLREPESCFEIDSDEEDIISITSESSRDSISSCDEGFVPTPLTAIPAKAYSNPQKVHVRRTSSQVSESDIRLSLIPEALRTPTSRSVPMTVMRNQPKFTPWESALNTPPMSPEHYSDILEYNQNLTAPNRPRKSSLSQEPSQPHTPHQRYSTDSDSSSDMTPGSPPLTPSDYSHSTEEEDFATPTQESISRQSHHDLPKVRLDLLIKTPSQSATSTSFNNSSNEDPSAIRHPPILPSQIDSFSVEDEFIMHDLEKSVCSPNPSLFLSTSCISQIRTITHTKANLQPTHPAIKLVISNNSRQPMAPHQFHGHPLKSHPPNIPSAKPRVLTSKKSITNLFGHGSSMRQRQQGESQQQPQTSRTGTGISNLNPKCQQQSQDVSTPSQSSTKLAPITPTPSAPDLSTFRIIFPSTTDSKRDELYAYLLAYHYLTHLPKPLSSSSSSSSNAKTAKNRGNALASPFHSVTKIEENGNLPELPTPETIITEKAAATLGIMSSEESLRTVRLEYLAAGLIERVKEGISRLVGEMDSVSGSHPRKFNSGGANGGEDGKVRGEGYVVESTLLRTLVEHVGVCEENGKLEEENGGLWKRILLRFREGMGITVG